MKMAVSKEKENKRKYVAPLVTELGDEVTPIAATVLSQVTSNTTDLDAALKAAPSDVQQAARNVFIRF